MAKTERWSEEVRHTGSEPQRRFVLSYRPVITQIAHQVASGLPPAVELNDLISDGTIGLIKAIGSYDSSRQVQFSSYAEGRIRGAILDGLRSLDWMPRSLRRNLRQLEKARFDLQQVHGRPATSEELAGEMDLTLEELHELLSSAAPAGTTAAHAGQVAAHPQGPPALDELPDSHGPDPQAGAMQLETRELLSEALECLPRKESIVLTLYYFGDMNLKEIGGRLGLSESRICQIHGRAMCRIRKILTRIMSHPRGSRVRSDVRRLQEAS
ncbi:MAG TPA: FliA/WhiG family RNA polymerase sigma factor [Candidatus Polarisedimenticolia bacterium]|jgi:RNA polymerase sigma factor for flagellar operon FliA